jgi:hypothetical protein
LFKKKIEAIVSLIGIVFVMDKLAKEYITTGLAASDSMIARSESWLLLTNIVPELVVLFSERPAIKIIKVES